ncbi:MAG TPA: GMC family oxidoreductase [Polyangiaceae bacterium]|nr:GMC family oxidoreductase [Polyangiaceae bacterium]
MTEIVSAESLSEDLNVSADVVVVGSGAGGAVIAAVLAEAGQSVVILEEGPYVAPETYGKMRPSENMRTLWRDGGMTFALGLGDTPMINVMMGKCVGGSSVLTGGVCFRIPGHIMHEWSNDLGLHDLTEEKMQGCFEQVERDVHVEEVPRHMRSRSTSLFVEGAERLGHVTKPVRRNTKGCNGCGRCNFGCPEGAKLSVDVTYLPRALAAGARLFADCRVDEILRKGGHATGVTGRVLGGPRRRAKGRFTVRARRVVVAAGAYASPMLLKRNGIGVRSKQVGRNLTVHPAFRVMARFDEPVRGWQGALQSAYTDAFEAQRITMVGLFVPPGVLAATMPGIGRSHAMRAATIPYLSIFGGMIHDDGGGQIHDVFGRPVMTYRMSPRDRATVPILMRRMAEIYFAAGAKEVFLPILGLGGIDADRLRSLDLESVKGRDLECGSQHPLGTCRMGIAPGDSVVDPWGQAWDLNDLFVADGSIIPTSLGVNPQLSIMSMAMRIAWHLRERPFSN